jgi:hypothetical protein
MLPTITARGVRDSFQLLAGIRDRLADSSPAYGGLVDDVLDFQRRWWAAEYGGQTDQDTRPGRDPRYMIETGGLLAAATVRGAPRQDIGWGPTYLHLTVTHGLGVIHEARGRPVLGEPGRREANEWGEQIAEYILTGNLARG